MHPFFAVQLYFKEFEEEVLTVHIQVVFLRIKCSCNTISRNVGFQRLIDFQHQGVTIAVGHLCPCSGVWTQTTDEVIDALHRLLPVDLTGLLENLRSKGEWRV